MFIEINDLFASCEIDPIDYNGISVSLAIYKSNKFMGFQIFAVLLSRYFHVEVNLFKIFDKIENFKKIINYDIYVPNEKRGELSEKLL